MGMTENQIVVVKANGDKEPFDIAKLEHSLRRAHASAVSIKKVTDHILQELEDEMTTLDIYHHAFSLLNKIEKEVAFSYSIRKAVMELGPSGFPFERYVAELFKAQGYTTEIDQIVVGACAEHEVDVVAWKDNRLVMTEVKFHHEPGLKSDLKVVLYVKARFEDLATQTFSYGGVTQKLTEGMLITNTKFTVTAIKYARCQNLNIVGWNYPLDGNLQEMIVSAGLHPITCLHTLSDHDKKSLIEKNIVLCKTIVNNPSVLKEIGLNESNSEIILEEINTIIKPSA
jgi:hypothetical protein